MTPDLLLADLEALRDRETSGSKRHRHTFHALYYHFGPFGEQGVHVHPCWDEDCDRVLVGEGRECDGERSSHRRRLTLDGVAGEEGEAE